MEQPQRLASDLDKRLGEKWCSQHLGGWKQARRREQGSARAVPLRQLHKHQSSPSLRQFSAVTAVRADFDDVSPDRRFRALSRAATRAASAARTHPRARLDAPLAGGALGPGGGRFWTVAS